MRCSPFISQCQHAVDTSQQDALSWDPVSSIAKEQQMLASEAGTSMLLN